MRHLIFSCLALWLTATAAQAACYADYKAKQDDPLRLHYGVIAVQGDCTIAAAQAQLQRALPRDGWQLLTVLGVFDASGLDGKRDNAGEYFLRY